MIAQQQAKRSKNFLLSCRNCSHVRVCAVFRAIAPLIKNWTDETKPFDPDNLAAICREYKEDHL